MSKWHPIFSLFFFQFLLIWARKNRVQYESWPLFYIISKSANLGSLNFRIGLDIWSFCVLYWGFNQFLTDVQLMSLKSSCFCSTASCLPCHCFSLNQFSFHLVDIPVLSTVYVIEIVVPQSSHNCLSLSSRRSNFNISSFRYNIIESPDDVVVMLFIAKFLSLACLHKMVQICFPNVTAEPPLFKPNSQHKYSKFAGPTSNIVFTTASNWLFYI
jgi:hypothetical protein